MTVRGRLSSLRCSIQPDIKLQVSISVQKCLISIAIVQLVLPLCTPVSVSQPIVPLQGVDFAAKKQLSFSLQLTITPLKYTNCPYRVDLSVYIPKHSTMGSKGKKTSRITVISFLIFFPNSCSLKKYVYDHQPFHILSNIVVRFLP